MSFWIAPGAVGIVVYALCKAVLYLTPALWHRFRDGGAWSLSPPRAGGWRLGIASGAGIGVIILAASWILGDRAIDVELFRAILAKNGLSDPAKFLLAAAWLSIVNSLLEEYAFRWFITTRFEALAPRGAVVLSALAFTAHHVIVLLAYLPLLSTLLASAGIFVGGMFWSWLYRRTRSVWPCWISHALVDAAIMLVGWQALFRQ
ncbi:MAG: CPBP family intramembrane glutamic endopeptidase [Phycisphaerales bacterium]